MVEQVKPEAQRPAQSRRTWQRPRVKTTKARDTAAFSAFTEDGGLQVS
ncbi:hypothetical protein J2Y54_002889 [Sphingomonas sp. BE123]|jgi:hypothetical protein|nr:hypothetical protein [Sphingomonas sp. BE123]MDR6853369.1 hypothetical protein [Sphingomonas sp. BE123]